MLRYLFSICQVTFFAALFALPAQGREPSEPKEVPTGKSSPQDKTAEREVRNSVYLGIFTVPLRGINNRVKKGLHLKDDNGVIIVEVLPDSPATQAGLREKDVITRSQWGGDRRSGGTVRGAEPTGSGREGQLVDTAQGEKQIIVARLQETSPEVITFRPYGGSGAGGASAERAAGAARESMRRIQELEREIARLQKRLREMEKAQVVRKP